MSRIGSVMTVSDSSGEILTPSVGTSALKSSVVDGVGVTLTGGALALQTAGASLANGVQRDEMSKYAGVVIKGDLADARTGGGVASVENTYGSRLVITRVTILVTTGSTGASTINVGVNSSGTTSDDDLIDGATTTAIGSAFLIDNIDDQGTNGQASQIWDSGQFVTFSEATGDVTGLVGTYAIEAIDIT